MTSKERMLVAMCGGKPDMVPVAPDISNMIPCRLTGKPFWDIYRHGNPPLWRAYLDAVRFFGMDGWHIYAGVQLKTEGDRREWSSETISESEDRFVVRNTCKTPAGELWSETTYYIADPPTTTRGWIKDIRQDLPKLRYWFPEITGYDPAPLKEQMECAGDDAAVGCSAGVPGLHELHGWFDGGVTAAVYAMADYPDECAELLSMQERQTVRHAEMIIDARPDFLMIGASGLWTLSSPEIVRKVSLPAIQKITRMCKEAGMPSLLHSCGKERKLVDIFVNETDLDCVNPLERSPMGDCDLAEIKRAYAGKIALMGNLHTTDVMLRGSVEDVRKASMEAIDAAAEGGGFILSTGDQCGRDTPYENIRAMVEVARTYGVY
jgi:uroporphyrinogen decarboxylase